MRRCFSGVGDTALTLLRSRHVMNLYMYTYIYTHRVCVHLLLPACMLYMSGSWIATLMHRCMQVCRRLQRTVDFFFAKITQRGGKQTQSGNHRPRSSSHSTSLEKTNHEPVDVRPRTAVIRTGRIARVSVCVCVCARTCVRACVRAYAHVFLAHVCSVSPSCCLACKHGH